MKSESWWKTLPINYLIAKVGGTLHKSHPAEPSETKILIYNKTLII